MEQVQRAGECDCSRLCSHRYVRVPTASLFKQLALANTVSNRNTDLRSSAEGYQQRVDRAPAGRWGFPADLVGPAIFLASSASQYVCGEVLVVDGVSEPLDVLQNNRVNADRAWTGRLGPLNREAVRDLFHVRRVRMP